jgi:hypothetical protein
MTLLNTAQDVKKYTERIVRQTAILVISPFFTDQQRTDLLDCYKKVEAICNESICNDAMLAKSINVIDSQTL